MKAYERRKRTGVTPETYADALAEQLGQCAICKDFASSLPRALAADHDHATGAFRGLLCGRCNTALGLLRDDERLVASALAYLRAAAEGRRSTDWEGIDAEVVWRS